LVGLQIKEATETSTGARGGVAPWPSASGTTATTNAAHAPASPGAVAKRRSSSSSDGGAGTKTSSTLTMSPGEVGKLRELYAERIAGFPPAAPASREVAHEQSLFSEVRDVMLYLCNDILLTATHERVSTIWGRAQEKMKTALQDAPLVRTTTVDNDGVETIHKVKSQILQVTVSARPRPVSRQVLRSHFCADRSPDSTHGCVATGAWSAPGRGFDCVTPDARARCNGRMGCAGVTWSLNWNRYI
jgi:hypothetical protein